MATNPLNPKKEHRKMKKVEARLEARIKDWEASNRMSGVNPGEFTKLGSRKIR